MTQDKACMRKTLNVHSFNYAKKQKNTLRNNGRIIQKIPEMRKTQELG